MKEKEEKTQEESQPEADISESVEAEEYDQEKLELEQDQENLELEEEQEAPSEKEPPSKFVRILRKGLIGLGVAAALFLAGFLTDHFVRYVPLSEELESTRAELEQTQEEVSDLQDENDRLESANQAAENEIENLEEELTAAQANLLFYQVLVNVNSARVELFLEDIESAQMALVNTQDNLEDLIPFIEEVNPELALSLPRRLDLIIAGLERDPETARIDLQLLTKDLLALEPELVED